MKKLLLSLLLVLALVFPAAADWEAAPKSTDPVWFVGSSVVKSYSTDDGKFMWEEYHLTYGTVENEERLKKYANLYCTTVGYCYGSFLDVEEYSRLPVRQNFEWELVPPGTSKTATKEDIAKATEFVENLPVHLFPFKFTVVVYWKDFDLFRVYFHSLYDTKDYMYDNYLDILRSGEYPDEVPIETTKRGAEEDNTNPPPKEKKLKPKKRGPINER